MHCWTVMHSASLLVAAPAEQSLNAAFRQKLLVSACLPSLQPSVNFPYTLQEQLHRRQHLLLQQGDLLFGIGIVDPAVLNRQASAEQQQPLQGLLASRNQAAGIVGVEVQGGARHRSSAWGAGNRTCPLPPRRQGLAGGDRSARLAGLGVTPGGQLAAPLPRGGQCRDPEPSP